MDTKSGLLIFPKVRGKCCRYRRPFSLLRLSDSFPVHSHNPLLSQVQMLRRPSTSQVGRRLLGSGVATEREINLVHALDRCLSWATSGGTVTALHSLSYARVESCLHQRKLANLFQLADIQIALNPQPCGAP